MRVDGIGTNPIAPKPQPKVEPQQEPAVAEEPIAEPVENVESEDQAKGVLRLLQEGHFKGTADVRLRINFHEELQALESQALKDDAETEFETFNGTIEEPLDALEGADELTPEQLAAIAAFHEGVDGSQGEFLAADTPSVEDLADALRDALDTLSGFFAPAENAASAEDPLPIEEDPVESADPDASAEGTVPEEPATEAPAMAEEPAVEGPVVTEEPAGDPQPVIPETTVTDLFNELQSSFEAALERLEANLEGSGGLPEISEPSGSGKAFDKFMAIYNEMTGPDPAEPVQVDELEPTL